jgi:hypothetical protein
MVAVDLERHGPPVDRADGRRAHAGEGGDAAVLGDPRGA